MSFLSESLDLCEFGVLQSILVILLDVLECFDSQKWLLDHFLCVVKVKVLYFEPYLSMQRFKVSDFMG